MTNMGATIIGVNILLGLWFISDSIKTLAKVIAAIADSYFSDETEEKEET